MPVTILAASIWIVQYPVYLAGYIKLTQTESSYSGIGLMKDRAIVSNDLWPNTN